MLLGFEAGQYFRSVAEGVGRALRPKTFDGVSQRVTWKPPPPPDGSSATLAAVFQNATDLWERATATLGLLRNRLNS